MSVYVMCVPYVRHQKWHSTTIWGRSSAMALFINTDWRTYGTLWSAAEEYGVSFFFRRNNEAVKKR